MFDISSIIDRLEAESELKMWAGIYISGDTNLHPHIVELMSESMIGAGDYRFVIELGAHHCVCTRYFAIHNPDCQFLAVADPDDEVVKANIGEFDNVQVERLLPDLVAINPDLVIINHGLTKPDDRDIDTAFNLVWYNGGRILFCGYEAKGKKQELLAWAEALQPKMRRLYNKMDSVLFQITI